MLNEINITNSKMEKITGKIQDYKIYFALLSYIIFVKHFIYLLNILLFLRANSFKNTSGVFIFSVCKAAWTKAK